MALTLATPALPVALPSLMNSPKVHTPPPVALPPMSPQMTIFVRTALLLSRLSNLPPYFQFSASTSFALQSLARYWHVSSLLVEYEPASTPPAIVTPSIASSQCGELKPITTTACFGSRPAARHAAPKA